jgi:hypothetical protein
MTKRVVTALSMIATEWADWTRGPASLGRKNTQRVHVRIESDIDAHCERSRRADAKIAKEPCCHASSLEVAGLRILSPIALSNLFASAPWLACLYPSQRTANRKYFLLASGWWRSVAQKSVGSRSRLHIRNSADILNHANAEATPDQLTFAR